MLKKIMRKVVKILLEFLWAIIYGVVLYFVFTWLAGYSLLYAYFANLALMILFFAIEELSIRALESKNILRKISEREDREKVYRRLQNAVENSISFKTILYLVYVFILIFSQIINTYPALVSEDISDFVLSNNYSILLLIALDMLTGQISKERERMKKLSAELEKSFDDAGQTPPLQ